MEGPAFLLLPLVSFIVRDTSSGARRGTVVACHTSIKHQIENKVSNNKCTGRLKVKPLPPRATYCRPYWLAMPTTAMSAAGGMRTSSARSMGTAAVVAAAARPMVGAAAAWSLVTSLMALIATIAARAAAIPAVGTAIRAGCARAPIAAAGSRVALRLNDRLLHVKCRLRGRTAIPRRVRAAC
jgi:hypothetical protein